MGATRTMAAFLIGLAVTMAAGGSDLPADTDTSAELVTLTEHAKKLFDGLTREMHKLADLLEKTDPDSARALRQAVNQAQRAMIADDMARVVEHLRRGLANPALEKQEEVVADLKKVLDALRRGERKLDERRKTLKDLTEFLATVNRLIQKERQLEAQSRHKAGEKAMNKRMQGLSRRLDDIIAEQKKLLDKTLAAGKGDQDIRQLAALRDRVTAALRDQERIGRDVKTAPVERLPVAGVIQERLGDRADKLARDIAAAAGKESVTQAMTKAGANPKALGAAAEHVGAAAREMKQAGRALGKSEPAKARMPHSQALSELRSAEDALTTAIDKMLGGDRTGELADMQKQVEQKTKKLSDDVKKAAADAGVKPGGDKPGADNGAENLKRAAKQMSNAAGKLVRQQIEDAAKAQKKAVEELEGKKYSLAQLHRRMKEKADKPLEKQKQDQKRVGDETSQLAEQMKKSAQGRPGAPKSTAGQKSVSGAAKSMGKAAGKLGQGKPGQANQDQKESLKKLQQAREQLEDEIAREAERLREEELARIDQMLARMLKTQKNISKETKLVAVKLAGLAKAGAAQRRAAELKVAELSKGEGRLAARAERIIKMLRKEGSTFVFPSVLEEVRKDLTAVADRLAAKRCGALTRNTQRQIEQSLAAMIDAIRKELADRKRESSGGGRGRGRGGGKAPLVPGVAELKMLRVLQLQVNARTKVLDREGAMKALPAKQVSDEYKALADREKKIRTLTEKLAAKIYGKKRTVRKVEK